MSVELQPVTSSWVQAAGYDPDEQVLRMQFKDGHIVNYHGVDPELSQSFFDAPKKGRFVHQMLKHLPTSHEGG